MRQRLPQHCKAIILQYIKKTKMKPAKGEGRIGSLGLADANSYIGGINNNVLLCSTGNVFNILCETIMEKNMKKQICLQLGHFAVQQKLAQHCKSSILNKFF